MLFTQDTINRLVPTSIQVRLGRLIFAPVLWEVSYHCILAVSRYWRIEKPTHFAPERPLHCWWKLDGPVLFSLSVTIREELLWAAQAFAGRWRGGGEVSLPSTLINPSQREGLLHVAQGRSFTQRSPWHWAWQTQHWSCEWRGAVVQLSVHGCEGNRLEFKRLLGSGLNLQGRHVGADPGPLACLSSSAAPLCQTCFARNNEEDPP